MDHIIDIECLHYGWHYSTWWVLSFLFIIQKVLLGPAFSQTHRSWVWLGLQIFLILFFCLFRFFFLFSYLIFFSYGKEEINWWDLFYTIQKLGDDNCFSFKVGLNFLIKACLCLPLKNILKKLNFFFFHSN
jgi:hypothetical protein